METYVFIYTHLYIHIYLYSYIVIINEAKSIERYLCDKISSNIVQFQKVVTFEYMYMY